MFSDDDLLPVSALQHLVFCERQCMLIHVEGAWAENRYTAHGRVVHERTHEAASGMQGDRLIARGLRLASYRLGLSGIADVVEFNPVLEDTAGILLPGRPGRWAPYPVEYKRGRPKAHNADAVQLCAQAMCLEEMLGATVPAGALFYGRTRRRQKVRFDASLRTQVEDAARRLHQFIDTGITPPPQLSSKCKQCSLRALCLPNRPASAESYLRRTIVNVLRSELEP